MRKPGLLFLISLAACDAESKDDPTSDPAVAEARTALPTPLALQSKVIARTCSPNPGVCHQSNNYPELRTPGSLLAMIGMPCNLQIPDVKQGWDACERRADRLVVGSYGSDIAWKEKVGAAEWKIQLRTAPLTAQAGVPKIVDAEGDTLLDADEDLGATVEIPAGSNEALLKVVPTSAEEDFTRELDLIMSLVDGGDPNRNGIWGRDDASVAPGAMIVPGDPSRSYLWGRITGTVPGSRMPLANQPLSNAEYLALGCWIEGLRSKDAKSDDHIDYDGCTLARSPLSFATR